MSKGMMMAKNEKIFLTPEQAISAIETDFIQYETQFELLQEICPIITGQRAH